MAWEEVTIGPCRLIRGKAEDILPFLDPYDLCLTDPPYGTGVVKGGGKHAGVFHARREKASWDVWSTAWLAVVKAKSYAVFCPHMHLGELLLGRKCALRYYIKSNPRPGLNGLDAPSVEPIVIWPRVRWSQGPAHRIVYNDDLDHPNGKPLAIMAWLVQDLTMPGETIIDPFAGSFTSGVAAVVYGRRYTGIEQESRWFDLGCQRIEQAYAQPDLFVSPPARATQLSLGVA